jgi:predicted nucleic acid-binding protein
MALASEADYLVTGDHRAGLLQCGSLERAHRHTRRLLRRGALKP